MSRRLKSWLKGLSAYVENTEAPREFWHWAGVSTIASALQRKVWLPFGIETYYPNLYIVIIGPPATRKGAPVGLSKRFLQAIQVPVSKDSGSKRNLTMELAETGKTEYYQYKGKHYAQCALSVISKEMSSILAVNPKEMVECLTDLFDSHDVWEYGTRGQGEDKLFNVCVNCLFATTPTSLATNLPPEAIGGGYTSRNLFVYGDKVYKRVPRPQITKEQEQLFEALTSDLLHISGLVGEFSWTDEAERIFDPWYEGLDKKLSQIRDEKLKPFIGRIHAVVLKTAMVYRVDYSDDLILGGDEISAAIEAVEATLETASNAFGGHGSSRTGIETYKIMEQIKLVKEISFRELLRNNYRNTNKTELEQIITDVEAMGLCKVFYDNERGETIIQWRSKVLRRKD